MLYMLHIFVNVVFCGNFMLQNKSGKISKKILPLVSFIHCYLFRVRASPLIALFKNRLYRVSTAFEVKMPFSMRK